MEEECCAAQPVPSPCETRPDYYWPESGHYVNLFNAINGLVIKVGCKTLVFNDIDEGLNELRRYLENPQEVELEYLKRYGKKGR